MAQLRTEALETILKIFQGVIGQTKPKGSGLIIPRVSPHTGPSKVDPQTMCRGTGVY